MSALGASLGVGGRRRGRRGGTDRSTLWLETLPGQQVPIIGTFGPLRDTEDHPEWLKVPPLLAANRERIESRARAEENPLDVDRALRRERMLAAAAESEGELSDEIPIIRPKGR